jgi:hypothetical protein
MNNVQSNTFIQWCQSYVLYKIEAGKNRVGSKWKREKERTWLREWGMECKRESEMAWVEKWQLEKIPEYFKSIEQIKCQSKRI